MVGYNCFIIFQYYYFTFDFPVIALTMSSFCIKSVSPLQYHQASPNMVHTLTMVSTCEPGIYHLTSFSWSTDLAICRSNLLQKVYVGRSFCDQFSYFIIIQSRCTMFDPHIDHGGSTAAQHVYLNFMISFSIFWG